MHHPVLCVTPPHILTALIQRGGRRQRKLAMATLHCTERLRGHREALCHYDTLQKESDKYRVVENANNGQDVTGSLLRKEGDTLTGDQAADEAYAFTGNVYDFYWDVFERNSIDDKGAKLYSTVHFGVNFNNAFWNGQRMVYGDGDGTVFDRFTKCVEVIGHELTHGVTNTTANLAYHGQAGALNESISDVFGCMVKQYAHGQKVGQASWVIGEGLFMPGVKGVGVRSLAEPGSAYDDPVLGNDPCPADMGGFVATKQDNGGIHINCTIPSHAFYLACVDLGGYSWQTLGPVWYNTLVRRLGSKATFEGFADATMRASRKLNGMGNAVSRALGRAWRRVKVL